MLLTDSMKSFLDQLLCVLPQDKTGLSASVNKAVNAILHFARGVTINLPSFARFDVRNLFFVGVKESR